MEIREFWSRIVYHLLGTVHFDKKDVGIRVGIFSHLV